MAVNLGRTDVAQFLLDHCEADVNAQVRLEIPKLRIVQIYWLKTKLSPFILIFIDVN